MACSVKCIAGFSAGSVLLGLATLILGIVVMTSSVPTSQCGTGGYDIGVSSSEQDDADSALMVIGSPLLGGGIIALIGGGVGIWAGMTANTKGICCESVVNGIAGGLTTVGALGALLFAAVFNSVCDEFECGRAGCRLAECTLPDVCCKGNCDYIFQMELTCKETHEWFCDMGTLKTITLPFAILASILLLTASCCGCAASCCCPQQFTEMMDAGGSATPPGGPGVTVVGMPVSAPNQGAEKA